MIFAAVFIFTYRFHFLITLRYCNFWVTDGQRKVPGILCDFPKDRKYKNDGYNFYAHSINADNVAKSGPCDISWIKEIVIKFSELKRELVYSQRRQYKWIFIVPMLFNLSFGISCTCSYVLARYTCMCIKTWLVACNWLTRNPAFHCGAYF